MTRAVTFGRDGMTIHAFLMLYPSPTPEGGGVPGRFAKAGVTAIRTTVRAKARGSKWRVSARPCCNWGQSCLTSARRPTRGSST